MRVLMLNPPFLPKYSRSSRSPAVTKSGTIYFPIWLAYATGVLEKGGHSVLLLDAPADGLSLDDVIAKARAFSPELLVCDTSTPSIYSDAAISGAVKKAIDTIKICVLVGTHPSALPEETLSLNPAIDAIARREYDYTLQEIADNSDKGNTDLDGVLGLTYRKGQKTVKNPDRPYVEDMDSIPFISEVYKKHLNINHYFYAHVKNPTLSFFGGRGCPNKCFYCVYPQVMFGHRYRHRSAKNIVEEMLFIKENFPEVKEVLIDDDNFTIDQGHVVDFCRLLIEKKLRLPWTVEARVNLKYETMVMMKKAGCRLLVAGFESGNQRVLDSVNKGITLEQSREFCRNAKKVGIRVHGCFMVGNRGDTKESIRETVDFALRLNPDTAQFFPLMVYPGTEAFAWASSSGYITTKNYRNWLSETGMHNCVLSMDGITPEMLVEFCDQARRRFYFRPSYIINKGIDVLLHPGEMKRTFKAAFNLIGHLNKNQ